MFRSIMHISFKDFLIFLTLESFMKTTFYMKYLKEVKQHNQ